MKAKGWGRRLLLLALGLILGLGLYRWNAGTLAGNALPMPFGYGTAVVLSGSMEPALSVGDLVLVGRCPAYELGDVVVYEEAESLVIHRVVALTEEGFVTQGDANNAPDEPVPREAVLGKLLLRLPGLGKVAQALKSLPGTLLLVGLTLLLLERAWRKEKAQDQERLDALKAEIRALRAELEEAPDAQHKK